MPVGDKEDLVKEAMEGVHWVEVEKHLMIANHYLGQEGSLTNPE